MTEKWVNKKMMPFGSETSKWKNLFFINIELIEFTHEKGNKEKKGRKEWRINQKSTKWNCIFRINSCTNTCNLIFDSSETNFSIKKEKKNFSFLFPFFSHQEETIKEKNRRVNTTKERKKRHDDECERAKRINIEGNKEKWNKK